MAVKPSFITGASARIRVGGKTFAYASDVSYQVSVDTIPVETMGRYEAVTNEPVNHSVAGQLSIVRYTKFAGTAGNPYQANQSGGNGMANSGLAGFFDPGLILASQSVDIEIYQKQTLDVSTGQGAGNTATATPILVAKIRDCRMNRLSGGINKRGILVETMSFVGVLFDSDDNTSSHSADTDLS
jgi:hypothetical protein